MRRLEFLLYRSVLRLGLGLGLHLEVELDVGLGLRLGFIMGRLELHLENDRKSIL